MKNRVIFVSLMLLLLAPMVCFGQGSIKSLFAKHSSSDGVEQKEFSGAALWAMKKMAPKGSMKDVDKITMLIFEDGTKSDAYTAFASDITAHCAAAGIECAEDKKSDKGRVRVFADKDKTKIDEFVMLMELKQATFAMFMEGEITVDR